MVGSVINPYLGDMPLAIGGERFTLRFSWAALARVKAELGADGQTLALAGDLDRLAVLVSIGLAHHHPDITADFVREASPPDWPTVKAVGDALTAAYYGPSGMPKELAENPPMPPQTTLKRLWRRLTGQV